VGAFICNSVQILAVAALAKFVGASTQSGQVDEALMERDLLRAGDFEALPLLENPYELGRLEQGIRCAGIEPGETAPHLLEREPTFLEIDPVEVGNLQLAAGGGFHRTATSGVSMSIEIS
jgi:hypothetical protein